MCVCMYVCMYVYVYAQLDFILLSYLPNPSARTGYDTKLII